MACESRKCDFFVWVDTIVPKSHLDTLKRVEYLMNGVEELENRNHSLEKRNIKLEKSKLA
ncbi:hypothetical protein FRX31_007317 [Thalictrum thalictroides]|uniref:Uncharacterized protein n=1 Tax=Thalictrum thalictroides TaxID=46969 RepID=A0A7J6X2S9_THATH|nr:hypothetical protein FRX31_007317 [Thalictrum thalictroides]